MLTGIDFSPHFAQISLLGLLFCCLLVAMVRVHSWVGKAFLPITLGIGLHGFSPNLHTIQPDGPRQERKPTSMVLFWGKSNTSKLIAPKRISPLALGAMSRHKYST